MTSELDEAKDRLRRHGYTALDELSTSGRWDRTAFTPCGRAGRVTTGALQRPSSWA
jgi:hypothetical protein